MIKKGACLLAFLLLAQGIFAGDNNFVNAPASAIIKSPADARGPHNVDCCLSEADTVEETFTKVCAIDSKIDALDFNVTVTLSDVDIMVDLTGVYTAIAEVESKVCIVEDTTDETLSKVCVIDSKLDDLDVNVDLSEVISKVCVVDSKVDIVDEIADETLSKVCVIDSKIDDLEVSGACDATPIEGAGTPTPATPITGPVTLDTSGHYCLTADLDVSSGDAIVITGTNVTLDLNGYTISGGGYGSNGIVISGDCAEVFNGTVSGFADAGISITGNKNNIHEVTAKDNAIGFELLGADNNIVEHSNAQCNTQAGFSLTNSNHNQFIDDKALSTSGTGDVYGFVSTGGLGNRFIDSLAADTDTTSVSASTVAGFALLNGEQCSEICGSTANKTAAATGTSDAYGVLVEQAGTKQYTFDTTPITGGKSFDFNSPSTAEFVDGDGTTYLDAKWYTSGSDKYLAVGGEADSGGVNVRILQYDSGTETLTALPYATFSNGAAIRSIDWIELYGRTFLAIGGDETYDAYSSNVRILEFDPTYGTLVEVANFDTGSLYQVNSLEWLPGTNYLAVTGLHNAIDDFAQILEFDATSDTLSLFATGSLPGPGFTFSNNELNWQTIGGTHYLVIAGNATMFGDLVFVVEFDPTMPLATRLTFAGAAFVMTTNVPLTAKWLSTGGTNYIAVGTDVGEILLYTFTSTAAALMSISSATTLHDANINDVKWLEASGCTFLGVSSNVSAGGNEFFMLEFNTADETFSEASGVAIDAGERINRFDWLDDGTIFAGLSYTPPTAADQSASVSNMTITSIAPVDASGTARLDAKWLVCDGVKYLAVAGDTDPSGANVKILQYDPVTDTLSETPYATFDHGATVRSIDWITCDGTNYLAIGGDDSYDSYSYNVRILEFDCAYGTLTEVANYDTGISVPYIGGQVNSLEWLPGTKYLAVTGPSAAGDAFVQILEFDPVGETLTLFTDTGMFPFPTIGNEVNWLTCEGVHYLSWVGSIDTGMGFVPFLLYFVFDPYAPSLTLGGGGVPPAAVLLGVPARTAKWLVCGDTKYIAVGTEGGKGASEILLYTFDPYAEAFTELPYATFTHDANINDVEWLEKEGCKFLGVTSDVSSGNEFFMLEFDPDAQTFSEVSGVAVNANEAMNRFDWLDCGTVCLAGYSLSPSYPDIAAAAVSELTVTTFTDAISNIVKNNVVIGTTGGSGGTGYSLNVDNNLLIGNVSCDNGTNYDLTGVIIQPDAIVKSQMDARGVQNVDCNLTNPDTVEVIESKVCEIDSKIDALEIGGGACDATPIEAAGIPTPPTPITGAVTITESGHYCLAADLEVAAGIAITISAAASNVTLDLNGYTVRNTGSATIGIFVDGANVEIHNGTVDSFTTGISLGGSKGFVHDVVVIDNSTGISCTSDTDTVLQLCRATGTGGGVGFSFDGSVGACAIDCKAYNVATGFSFSGVTESAFIRCIALNNSDGFVNTATAMTMSEFKDCQALYNTSSGFNLFSAADTVTLLRNVACGNGTNYLNVPSNAIITSAANADGWDNIDCSDDSANIVESKLCVIDSKIDEISGDFEVDLSGVYTSIAAVESKVCIVDETTDETLSKVCEIDSKIDTLGGVCDATPITASETPTPPTPITGPVTLDTSGHYCLSADLEELSGTAITITGSNVTLDLNGYTVNGNGYGNTGISVSGSNVEIFNGTIDGFTNFGITLNGSKAFVHDVVVINIDSTGISCSGDTDTILQSCHATENAFGFSLSDSNGACLIDCKAYNNTSIGFTLASTTDASCIRCIANNNGIGFRTTDEYVACEFKDCQALYNTTIGFTFFNAGSGITLLRNVACNNSTANYSGTANVVGVITSPKNARGWDNIDCSDTTIDINELIESKVCVIDSKIDDIMVDVNVDLSEVVSKICEVEEATGETFSKVCIIESIVENIMVDVDVDLSEVISKVCVVDSKVDELSDGQTTIIDNQAESFSKLCVVENNTETLIDGQAEIISAIDAIDIDPIITVTISQLDVFIDVTELDAIQSKLCIIETEIETVQEDVLEILSKTCVIESKIDDLEVDAVGACDPTPITISETPVPATPITGPVTLDASGHYCLAADLDVSSGDAIVITGDNVTLDLNGYTISGGGYAINGIVISGDCAEVFNGTVSGFADAGISITGNKNNIHDVDAKDNTIGFELVGANNNVIEHSRALCSTQAGFSLQDSNFNNFIDDQAVATSGDGDVYGFVSFGGRGNRFINSSAENTATSSTGSNTVAGFALRSNEQCSEICGSTVNKTTAATGYADAYGVFVQTTTVDKVFEFESPNTAVFVDGGFERLDAKWLECEGAKYLAVAGVENGSDVTVQILEYDPIAKTLTAVPGATFSHGATIRSIDWIVCDGRKFLAIGGDNTYDYYSFNVRILEFDCAGGTLTEVADFDSDIEVRSLEWLPGTKYLGITGSTEALPLFSSPTKVLEFDPTGETLTLIVESVALGSTAVGNELNWLTCEGVHYLVVAQSRDVITPNVVEVLTFDPDYPSLSLAALDNTLAGEPRTAKWLLCGDTKYIAVGTDVDAYGDSEVLLYTFSPPGTLTPLPSSTVTHNATINDVEWLEKSGCKFLGVSSDPSYEGNEFFLLELDITTDLFTVVPGVAINDRSVAPFDVPINRFDWLDCGDTILAGFSIEPPNAFFPSASVSNLQITLSATGNIIKNNVVNGTTGGVGGIGFSLNTDNNLLISNTSCNNGTNYDVSSSTFALSEIIKSQADARGVQNVDCSLTNPDSVEVIESKVCAIVDTAGGLDSKICVVESKVDELIDIACAPTLITQADIPLTISTAGHYILAEDVTQTIGSSAISIESDDVILDLCDHTVFGDNGVTYGIEVETDHTNIVIKNGVVSGISTAGADRITSGIVVKGGCSRIEIDNVDILNLRISGLGFLPGGIIIANTTGGIGIPDFSGYPLNDITHVTIKNCHIRDGAQAIRVLANAGDVISDLVIDGVDIDLMTSSAIDYTGSSGGGSDSTQITNSVIKNCTIMRSASIAASQPVATFANTSNLLVDSCMFNNNVSSTSLVIGISFAVSTLKCTVANCSISCNEAIGVGTFTGILSRGDSITVRDTTIEENASDKAAAGIEFNGSENGIIERCVIARNTASTGVMRGIYFTSSSNNGHIIDCICDSNTATTGVSVGIDIDTSETIMVSGCSATSQLASVSDAYGFRVTKTSSCIMFTDCVAKNIQGYTEGTGFLLEDITDSTVIRCISNKNQTTGFRTSASDPYVPVSFLEFKDCQAFYNGVHGFDLEDSDSTVRLFRNIASDNGTYP